MSRVFVKRDLPEFLARFEAHTNVFVQSGTVKGSEKLISIELKTRNTIALERIADAIDFIVSDLRHGIAEEEAS